MLKSMTLRATAKEIGISLGTAFAWRHKFLSKLEQSNIQLHSAVTVQEIKLPYSEKGTRTKTIKKQPPQKSILISDYAGNKRITTLRRRNTPMQKLLFTAINGIECITYIKRKQSNTEDLIETKKWLHTFRGVASKYLQNYWNWNATLELMKATKDELTLFKYRILSN